MIYIYLFNDLDANKYKNNILIRIDNLKTKDFLILKSKELLNNHCFWEWNFNDEKFIINGHKLIWNKRINTRDKQLNKIAYKILKELFIRREFYESKTKDKINKEFISNEFIN